MSSPRDRSPSTRDVDDDQPSKAIAEALAALDEELVWHARGVGTVGTPAQLHTFRHHLVAMQSSVDSGDARVASEHGAGMARAIVDAWPLDSELGSLILAAAQAGSMSENGKPPGGGTR